MNYNFKNTFFAFFLLTIFFNSHSQSSLFFNFEINNFATVNEPSFNSFLTKPFSIESVFKVEKFTEKKQTILHYYDHKKLNGFILYINTKNKLVFRLSNNDFIIDEYKLYENKCYQASITYKDNLLTIYINGEIVLEKEAEFKLSDLSKKIPLFIGGHKDIDNFFGEIDEVRLYSDVRSDEEIDTYLFSPLTNSELLNIEAYYSFDETYDQAIIDHSSNNNHGYFGSSGLDEIVDPKRIEANCVSKIYKIVNTSSCEAIHYDVQPIEGCLEGSHFVVNNIGETVHKEALKLYDRFGNIYCGETITTTTSNTSLLRQSTNATFNSEQGNFILIYDNIPQDFRTVIDQVFSDLEQLIVFQSNICGGDLKPTIRIDLGFSTSPTALATGSGLYDGYGANSMWKIVNGRYNSFFTTPLVGYITLNSNNLSQLYTGFATDTDDDGQMDQSTLYNLYPVILREALHIFGFASTTIQNGSGNISINRPSRYDHLLSHDGTPFLSGFPQMTYGENSVYNSTALTTECTNDIVGVHSNYKVYSPSSWDPGPSLSHFDDTNNCTGLTRVMGHSITQGQFTRISEDEINVH